MDADLVTVYDRVMSARRSEDVFQELTALLPPRLLIEHLAPEMDGFRKVLDEQQYTSQEDRDAAREARVRLESLYRSALEKAARGLYVLDDYTTLPPSGGNTVVVGSTTYYVGNKIYVGEHASLYEGRMAIDGGSARVIMRVAHQALDNPSLSNEIRVLDILHSHDVGYWKSIPFVLDRFMAGERVGIVYRYFDGVTLPDVRSDPLHTSGLDQRHMVWILDRLLSLLGYVHACGLVHGRIQPETIRIRPSNHNVLLTGWGEAVWKPAVTGEQLQAQGGPFEAPEVSMGREIGPWTDIYSLGKTMIWLLGGDPETNELPDTVHPLIKRFLLNMIPRNPRARPSDAWQLFQAQNNLKDSLWKRQFLHLNLTARR